MSKYEGTTNYHLVYGELIAAARYGGLTNYTRVAKIGGLPVSGNAMGQQVGEVLGLIVRNELDEGRPMLSAVCVNSRGKPSEGFFELARTLKKFKGESRAEQDAFWRSELAAVYEAWSKP